MENKNINVLIIEDNPADVRLVSLMLKEDLAHSFTIKSAGLLEEGLKLLGAEKFDVVLLDINLPDNYALSGLEKISSLYSGIPVILLTSLDDEDMGSNALQKNAADYLIKGQINTNLLVRSISYALERNMKENELRKLNRTHHALSEISKAMILLRDEPAFLKKVCGIIANNCGYPMVWIGYGEDDEAKTIKPMCYAGSEDGYLKTLNLTWADTERGQGPTGTAIRTGKVSICPNMLANPAFKPWREEALKRGYASSMAVPMNIGDGVHGALTIYSKETDPFSKDEVTLLAELVGYIAFGIMAIRSRVTQLESEEALKASEKKYRDLIETANSIIIRWTTDDGIVRYINDFGLKFFGYRWDEILGKSVMNLVPKSDSATGADLTRLAENIAGDLEKFRYSENENIKKNGERAWIIWANKAVKDEQGKLKEILCIGNDITELKNSENLLRYQAEILEAVSDAVIATDLSFNIASWNKRAELMYGWKAEEVLGKPIKDVVLSEMSEEQRAAIYKKVREGKAVPVEVVQYAKDGSKMISECYSMPVRDSAGVIKGYVTVNRNITERKQVAEALSASEIRYRRLFETAKDGILILDADTGMVVDANPYLIEMLGYPLEYLKSKAVWELGFLKDTIANQDKFCELQSREYIRYEDLPLETANGQSRSVEFVSNVYLVGNKQVVQCNIRDITKRKRAEEALFESEKRYHNLFNTMDEGFCVIQMIYNAEGKPVDYRFLEINKTFEKQTGLHNAQGKLMRELVPAHEEHWFEIYGQIAVTGESIHFTNEAKALDRYYDVYAYRVGRPEERQVAIIFNDISWHKRAENALKESEEKFRLLAESTPDVILRYNRNKKLLYANKAFYRLTGLSSEETIDKSPSEFGAATEAAINWGKAASKVMETGEPVSLENSGVWQGKARTFELHLVPERAADGTVPSIITIGHDITNRKKMEDALRESEQRLKFHFENSPLAVVEWDSDYIVTQWSGEAERMFGWKKEETIGKRIDTLNMIYADDIPIVNRTMERLGSGKEPVVVSSNRNYTKAGAVIECTWYNTAMVDKNGKMSSIMSLVQDITEKKKAEELLKRDKDTIEKLVVKRTQELLDAQVELERSRRLSDIGTLAATVAHELRNPLGVIRTAVYNIKRKSQGNNLDSHIANIEKKISESNQIINNLLDYSRIKVPSLENTQLHSILEECVNNEKEKFDKKKISFNKCIEPVKDLCMQADPLQLKEVFSNILDNACQALDKESGCINVSAALDGNKNVIITIEDNGAGIEPEDIKRLFEPFFTRKSKGTGLGLTICNQLIGLHNGKIDVASSLGNWTKVTLTLPVGGGKHEENGSHNR